jgi:hypothetical protein
MLHSSSQVFSDAEAKRLRDNEPTLSDRPWGIDLPAKLQALLDETLKVVSNTAVIPAASANVILPLGEDYDGKPVVATIMQDPADGTLVYIARTHWDGSGNLTVEGNATATADVTFAYMVDGR